MIALSSCNILAGAGEDSTPQGSETSGKKSVSTKAVDRIFYGEKYSGAVQVVQKLTWKDWLSQTRFFENFDAYTKEEKEDLNKEYFENRLTILNPEAIYFAEFEFKKNVESEQLRLIVKKNQIEGSQIEFKNALFDGDQIIKTSNIESSEDAKEEVVAEWKVSVSTDGTRIEGYRLGDLQGSNPNQFVTRFRANFTQ